MTTDLIMESFYIVDRKTNKFYCGESEYIPWIVNSFTDRFQYARVYGTAEEARKDCEKFQKTRQDFDGNSPLEKDRLMVVRRCFEEVKF